MNLIHSLATSAAHAAHVAHVALRGFEPRPSQRERGDVPGWVLITLMTAGLVTILWALASSQLQTLFTAAMSSVTGPGSR